jgi:hypothetical protein
MSATETINFTRGVPAHVSFPAAVMAACARRVLEQQAVSVRQ